MASLRIVGVLLLAAAILATSCATPPRTSTAPTTGEAPKASTPKRIVAAIRGDPHTLSEAVNFAAGGSSSAGVREIEQLLNAGLLVLDPRGELQPLLAEATPTLDNGLWKVLLDGRMETTWKLKPNTVWHDGKPLTTDDLLFAATVAQDKTLAMRQDESFKFVEALAAPDARTLIVTWNSTYVDADKLFTQTTNQRNLPLPAHLMEPVYTQDRAGFVENTYFGADYVGSGPYRLREWVRGSHLLLDANDAYVLGRPKVDTIEVKFILDTNTMVANLLSRAIDLTLGRGLNPEQAITVREQWKEGVVDAGLQNTTSLYPQFIDPEPAVLADARFRRALILGLDRQQIVDSLLGGLVPVADSIFSPDDPEYQELSPSMVKYPFDPRRATAILDEMGLTKGADGFYTDATGKKLSVEVRTRAHPLREKVQQVIADEWARIGIVGEPAVIPEQRINDRAYGAAFPGFYFRFGGPDQLTDWVSKEAPVAENNYVGRNPIRYQNPDYDLLINRLVTTIPRAERMKTMADMVRIETDQLLLVTLYHEPEPVLIGNRLINVSGRRGMGIQTWNVQTWDVATQ